MSANTYPELQGLAAYFAGSTDTLIRQQKFTIRALERVQDVKRATTMLSRSAPTTTDPATKPYTSWGAKHGNGTTIALSWTY